MSISDRLDEIEQHVNDQNPATGEESDYMVLEHHAPAMYAALRAVLNLHTESRLGPDLPHPYCGECGQILPCATRRVIAAALGEEA